MSFRRSVEMSLSREEFFRLLRAAVPVFDADGDLVRWYEGESVGTIRLVPLTHRRLGGAALPRHRVEIVLHAGTDDEGAAFMERFHRAFLRGGG